MSILLVNEVAVFGGVNRVVQSLWTWLPRLGFEARVMIPCGDGADTEKFISEWFGQDRRRVEVSSIRGQGRSMRRMLKSYGLFRGSAEPVVNFHFNMIEGTSLLIVLSAWLAGKRIAITYHHVDAGNSVWGWRRIGIRLALRLVGDVFVSTPLLADRLHEIAPFAKVHVEPLGVEPPSKRYDPTKLRRGFQVPSDAFVVGHFSRLLRDKGLPNVVKAIRVLEKQYPKIWLLACGSEDRDAPELRDLVARELPERHRFLGFLPDHNQMLACCDVLAVPSGWEGFGLVYVEAAFHGIPRIGTRMGGVPYVVDDGQDGLLIEPDDVEGLAGAISKLYDDPLLRLTMGHRAKTRALEEFTAERMAHRYVEVLGLG